MDDVTAARYERFLNSSVAKAHHKIREEVIAELHLEFEHRKGSGMHAVCAQCRGSVAQLTQQEREGHETSYAFSLDMLATLYMAHFMQRHYEKEGRRG